MTPNEQLDIFKSIFGTSSAFVYRCHNDDDYTMQFMSGQVSEITGYEIAEIENNAEVSFVGITHPDDKERVFAQVDEAIEKGEAWTILYRLMRKDGGIAHIREDGSAVFGEDGALLFLQGLITDAEPEVALRDAMAVNLTAERKANAEILTVSGKLADSLRTLSFVAVNARIEAARVGTAGQGFAVIAADIADLVKDNSEFVAVLEETIRSQNKAA